MKTRSIVNAAMMMAIYLVFFILYNVGILSGIIAFLLPIPFIVFHHVDPKRSDLFYMFIGCLIGTYLIGSIYGLLTTLLYGLTGIVLAIGMKKEWPYWNRIINAAIVSVIILPLTTQLISGMSMQQMFVDLINESVALVQEMPFIPAETSELMMTMYGQMAELIPTLMPTILIFIGGVSALITDKIGTIILKRMSIGVPTNQKLEDFQLGPVFAFILIACNFASAFISQSSLVVVMINIVILLNVLFIIQGFIVILSYFKSKNQKGLGIAVIVFALLSNLSLVASVIGLMDALFDYRARFNLKNT